MAMSDSYSQALASRRGKSLDPAVLSIDSAHGHQDVRKGLEAGASGNMGDGAGVGEGDPKHAGIDDRLGVGGKSTPDGEGAGTPTSKEPTAFDWKSPTHMDEHTAPAKEGAGASPAASWHDKGHGDEHTPPAGEMRSGQTEPRGQSTGAGLGEISSEVRDHVSDHASESEYHSLKNMKPRSLGERAKMEALKSKYSPAGSGKNG